MKWKERNGRKDPRILVCDIIIGIQAIVIVFLALALSAEFVDVTDNGYKSNSLRYCMEDGRYASMVERYHYNEAYDVRETSELSEYYGVARYYEAASLYKAYLTLGDEDTAARYKAAMDEAYDQMGAYAPEAERIESQLGIQ